MNIKGDNAIKKEREGETYYNFQNCKLKIIKYYNAFNCDIQAPARWSLSLFRSTIWSTAARRRGSFSNARSKATLAYPSKPLLNIAALASGRD